jgi:ABC-type Na+ efflux pump permease subunit
MSNIGLVTAVGIKNNLRMKTALIILLLVTLICIAGVAYIFCLLLITPEVESAAPDVTVLKDYLSLILYTSSLFSIGITLNSLIFQTLVREKARGNLNALLATPLKITDIWIGKTLALFLPGLALGILLTGLSLVIINMIYFVPGIGFLFSLEMALGSLVAVPLMFLFFGMLIHLIGMTGKASTGNVIAQVFLPVIANVMIQLGVRSSIGAGSWQFAALNLGIALLIGIFLLAFRSRLIRENIVLSG